MLLVYTTRINNRINYTFNLIFKDLLGVDIKLTDNSEEFIKEKGPKINYSKQNFSDEVFFFCSDLLFESGIRGKELTYIEFKGSKAFFPVYNKSSAFPFDPFAASFYLVTRYEEYLPYIKDRYGRFHVKENMAYKNGFLNKPVVNIWAREIGLLLLQKHKESTPIPRKFKHIPTIDVDTAYCYKRKGLFRNAGGYLKSLTELNFNAISERTKVLLRICDDPYDTYSYQFNIHKKYNLEAVYFILFAAYDEFDKNIPVQNSKFHELIKSLADYAKVGIHPSYASNTDFNKLRDETELLAGVLNREITISRQHYLKIDLPATYRNLLNLNVSNDYTMGFAVEPGFRAGICNSFNFYDLDMDMETGLRIHPFAVMDGTLCDYKQLSPYQAINDIRSIINEVKDVDGEFISLWHNDSLSETGRWKGWRRVYEEMLAYAAGKG
ncbi:MAG: polysaccharide deacetylase family protein [Bacteroidales bacterium]|nr:polysaccharide deacetylase family protein [Bacteroidales bacterium]